MGPWNARLYTHVLFELISLASSARLLSIPVTHHSHINMFSIAGKALKERGHDVHILVPESKRALADKSGLNVITYPTYPGTETVLSDKFMEDISDSNVGALTFMNNAWNMMNSFNAVCRGVHADDELINKLRDLRFDLAIVDGLDPIRCMYSLPYRLGLRYITFTARTDPWNAGIPAMPSVEPMLGLGDFFDEESSMFDRIKSVSLYFAVWMLIPQLTVDHSILGQYCSNRPTTTFDQLFRDSEMWLVKLETICLDTPRIYGNHYQFVGGMGLEPAKDLPGDLEDFVQGSSSGFIVLTFGSGLKNIPNEMLKKMLDAFAKVEHRVIMRHSGAVPDVLPENVKMMSWIPQADLLGHPQVRAFITHSGNNGQLEALNHGVPMISIPMFGDQNYNAARAKIKGFGVTLDRKTFTTEELVDAITKVAGGSEYRDRIKKCSDRFHSFPDPRDTIGFWVDHILEFGGDHLKPMSLKVPAWKMFMLDILVVFVIMILVSCAVIYAVCSKVRRRCRRDKISPAKKKN